MFEGHRDRVRERIKLGGFQNFSEEELLEYILFNYVARKDTKCIAKNLLSEFGSIDYVLRANETELSDVKGVTPLIAANLPNIYRLYGAISNFKYKNRIFLSTSSDSINFFCDIIGRLGYEVFVVACLDINYKLIKKREYTSYEGTQTHINFREIIEFIMNSKCPNVMLAHNHPGEGLSFSKADLMITEKLYFGICLLNVKIVDHIIVSEKEGISLNNMKKSIFSDDFLQSKYVNFLKDAVKEEQVKYY